MARYLTDSQAMADGFHIVHEPDQQRFALYATNPLVAADATAGRAGSDRRLIGEAHYSLRGAAGDAGASIDFDHTVVHPEFRGTGLSGLLAHHAVTSDVVHGRSVQASCWFIEGYLARHPELLTPEA